MDPILWVPGLPLDAAPGQPARHQPRDHRQQPPGGLRGSQVPQEDEIKGNISLSTSFTDLYVVYEVA